MRSLIAFAALLVSSTSFGDEACGPEKLKSINVTSDGRLVVSLKDRTPDIVLCNMIEQGNFAMVPKMCEVTHKNLLGAFLAKKYVTLYFTEECKSFPPWHNATSFYMAPVTTD